ncbi:MAG: hypothetical protein IID42_08935 [Planctomycetes bacterium]|nr:hypothetical protein [Planctomycetota bacterium]
MRTLKRTLLILALLVLTVQAVRHIYVRYIEPRTSVLDKFDDTEAKQVIQSAESLAELIKEYEPARKRVDELDEEFKKQASEKPSDEYYDLQRRWREDREDVYEREEELKSAIRQWEDRSTEILELRVFWLFGFAFFLIGAYLHRKGLDWIGMAFIISGFVEMIWWTSPTVGFWGSPTEFDRLLNNKLWFTAITIVLLIVASCLDDSTKPGKQ